LIAAPASARAWQGRHVMDLHRIPDDLSIPEFLRRKPRLPTAAEADEMCGRAFLEVFRELNEEKRKKGEPR
jgi:hypothetical protein